MFFFFHLLTGTILGLLIGDLFKDFRWVIPCAVGSVLPDLVDKPLGLVIFSQSIGNGYIYSHCLLAVLVLGALGLLLLKAGKNPVIAAIACGILSHQVLDLMWRMPKSWYFPVYGAFPRPMRGYDIITLLLSEITNPLEIFLFVCFCTGILLYVERDRIAATLRSHSGTVRALMICGMAGLFILSAHLIRLSREKTTIAALGWSRPEHFIIGAVVAAMAAVLVWRWYRKVLNIMKG